MGVRALVGGGEGSLMRQIDQAGLDLVKSFEGLFLQAYRDSVGVPTIGWGHTVGVQMGQTIDQAQAEAFLQADMADSCGAVERLVTVPLSDDQFSALVSFTFNCGTGALAGSTLLRLLNGGDYLSVPGQLMRWNHAGGQVLAGLTRRRLAEGALFADASTQAAVPMPPPTVHDAAWIQGRLNALGQDPVLATDGDLGPISVAAIAAFIEKYAPAV
jgi:lysozyme